MIWYLNVTLRL